jgi:hypothetical protein
MRQAVVGIAYYIWVSRRRPLQVALSLTVYLGIVGLLPVAKPVRVNFVELALLAAFACCAMLCMLFEYEVNPDRLGFPRSLFTLPVRTRTLVFWPWLIGTTSFGLWGVSQVYLVNWQYGADEPVVVFSLGLAVCVGWMQVALWTPFQSAFKLLILVAAVMLLGMFVAWLYVRSGLPGDAIAVVLGCLLALSYPAALAGVARDRRGDAWFSGLGTLWRLRQDRRRPASLHPPFGSAVRAQRWFNWRSPEALARTLGSAPLAAFFGLLFFFSRTATPTTNPHLVVFVGAAAIPICTVAPIWFLASRMPPPRGGKPIGLIESMHLPLLRPIGTGSLGVSLLLGLLRGAIWSWVFWLAFALLACLCWSAFSATPAGMAQELKGFLGRLSWWQCFAVVAFTFGAIIGLTWRLVADVLLLEMFRYRRYPDFVAAFLAVVGLNGLVAVGVSLLLDSATRPSAVGALAVAGVVILVVKVFVAGIALRTARRGGLFEAMSPRVFPFWLAIAAAVLGSTAILLPGLGLPVPTSLVLLWVAILLPLGRFALFPLGLEALRHR